ncbi:MAG: hypothetical protein ACYSU6_04490 [Planctomycetota bacterium]|jgi:hypothetical protein
MKDSKDYSGKVQKFYRKLKRECGKVKKPDYADPVGALVYGIIIRVSRSGEIAEVLGDDTAVTHGISSRLVGALQALFRKYNTVSLEALEKMSKRPARQVLCKIEGVSRFVVNYCMLMSLQSHAMPLTARMIGYLRSKELVHPESDEQEIEGFLMRQISVSEAYKFYTYLRLKSEGSGSKAKKRVKKVTKKKSKKKASKKRTRKRR